MPCLPREEEKNDEDTGHCVHGLFNQNSMSDPRPAFQINLGRLGQWLSGGSAAGPVAERDSAGLPYSQPDIINTLRTDYETAAQHGGAEATEACFKWVAR